MSRLSLITKNVGKVIADNSPVILTYMAAGGVLSTAVLAAKAGPKTEKLISEVRRLQEEEGYPEASKFDVLLQASKDYVPTALSAAFTIACIIGSNRISTRRNAALIGLYSLSETALREYREQVAETVGEKKELEIRDAATQKAYNRARPSQDAIIVGSGNSLTFDSYTGRFFESNVEAIRKAQNDINKECLANMYASHNDFYRLLNVDTVEAGEEVGWTTDHMMDIHFGSALTEDNKPYIVLEYRANPIRNYHKIHVF